MSAININIIELKYSSFKIYTNIDPKLLYNNTLYVESFKRFAQVNNCKYGNTMYAYKMCDTKYYKYSYREANQRYASTTGCIVMYIKYIHVYPL